jgi:hypothetical protein
MIITVQQLRNYSQALKNRKEQAQAIKEKNSRKKNSQNAPLYGTTFILV